MLPLRDHTKAWEGIREHVPRLKALAVQALLRVAVVLASTQPPGSLCDSFVQSLLIEHRLGPRALHKFDEASAISLGAQGCPQ